MKKKKDEEIDINLLPPWMNLKTMLLFNCPKNKADLVNKFLQDRPREYQKQISKTDVINLAKEKQMYIDPLTMTDKQKKDKTLADIPTELTPEILAKAFSLLLFDLDIQGRKVILFPLKVLISLPGKERED